jgi:hypothetical protein
LGCPHIRTGGSLKKTFVDPGELASGETGKFIDASVRFPDRGDGGNEKRVVLYETEKEKTQRKRALLKGPFERIGVTMSFMESDDREPFFAHHEKASECQSGSKKNQGAGFGTVWYESCDIGDTRRALDGKGSNPIRGGVAGDKELRRNIASAHVKDRGIVTADKGSTIPVAQGERCRVVKEIGQ